MAVPESIIVVGCNGQGLSIALALSYSYPMVKITVIDKQSPKITNESSPSTVCVLKNDYVDPMGLNSALEAQQVILRDSDLRRCVYPRGIVRAHDSSDPESSKDWQTSFNTIKYLEQKAFRENSEATTGSVQHFQSHKALFAHLHHGKTEPPFSSHHWNESYLYPAGAIVDFDQLVMVLYQRCQRQPNIKFILGHAIRSILLEGEKAKGVRLLDNSDFLASLVVLAPDTTDSALLSLLPGVDVSGHDVVWLKPSDDLTEKYKDIPVLINQSTGITIFPPMNGLFKCLYRSTGYKNTVAATSPLTGEQSTFTVPLESSWKVPLDAENTIRKALGELIPEFEKEPFARSALSWLVETPSGNPVIDFHPEIKNIFISVLGSDNSIFMPILGEKVVKLIDRSHSSVLSSEWKFPGLEKRLQGSIVREARYYKPIIIVGAGVFGLTSALHLARRGYQNITIFDSEPYDENAYKSSKAASADENKVIRASYGEQKLYEKLAFKALRVWEQWNYEVREAKNLPRGLSFTDQLWQNCGFLRATDSEGLDAAETSTQESFPEHLKGTQYRVSDENRRHAAEIDGVALSKLDPFNRSKRGLGYDGILDNTGGYVMASKSCAWVLHLCRQMGVKVKFGQEHAFQDYIHDGERVTGIKTMDGSSYPADLVIVAAGSWTPALVPDVTQLLEATAGSVVRIQLPKDRPDLWEKYDASRFPTWSWRISNWSPTGTEVGGIYGFPRTTSGIVKIGFRGAKYTNFAYSNTKGHLVSYPQRDARGIPSPAMDSIRKFCDENMPDLVGLPLTTRLCWYTDSVDNSFLIDHVPNTPGLMVASGGSGHGFKFLPVLGEHTVDVVEGKDTEYTRLFKWRQAPQGERNGLEEGPNGWRTLNKQRLVNQWESIEQDTVIRP